MTDMKQEILARLQGIYNALDHTEVSGRRNFNNMSASMGIIEELMAMVKRCEIAEIVEHGSGERQKK